MILPVKEKLLRLINRRILRKNPVARVNPSFSSARRIGILFSWENEKKEEAIDEFIKTMDLAGKDISIVCFFNNPKEIHHSFNHLILTRKDITIFGRIIKDDVAQFSNEKFDFLFHLDLHDNVFIENILAKTQSLCRVGRFDDHRKEYYDFMIETGNEKNIHKLCSEILKYTKLLVAYE